MAELNVTPLLDLAFVLLIIFIITTPLLENHIGIDISKGPRLPDQPLDPKLIRTVSIDQYGRIFLESQQVELPVLAQQLTAFAQGTPDSAVVIRADKGLQMQKVMDVINVLKSAKISRMDLDDVTP